MKTLLQNSEKERDKYWLIFKTSYMKPLLAEFPPEPLFIFFVPFFAAASFSINLIFDQSHFWRRFDILRLWHDFVFGQVKTRNAISYFICTLSKILSAINHTHFYLFYILKNHIFDGYPYTIHMDFPIVTLVIVPLNSVLKWVINVKTNLDQNCYVQPSVYIKNTG